MKCEFKGCKEEAVCFHYCHKHHEEICMNGYHKYHNNPSAPLEPKSTAPK